MHRHPDDPEARQWIRRQRNSIWLIERFLRALAMFKDFNVDYPCRPSESCQGGILGMHRYLEARLWILHQRNSTRLIQRFLRVLMTFKFYVSILLRVANNQRDLPLPPNLSMTTPSARQQSAKSSKTALKELEIAIPFNGLHAECRHLSRMIRHGSTPLAYF